MEFMYFYAMGTESPLTTYKSTAQLSHILTCINVFRKELCVEGEDCLYITKCTKANQMLSSASTIKFTA